MSDMAKSIPLPKEMIPFILKNIERFDAALEEGAIVITPKDGLQVSKVARDTMRSMTRVDGHSARTTALLRPKFIYSVKNKAYTPQTAQDFNMSKPRLRVYELVYGAGDKGIGYKLIRDKSGLQHGSVMQVLHWLRKQNLIVGKPEPQ